MSRNWVLIIDVLQSDWTALYRAAGTKLDIGLRPDPRACVLGCGFARLEAGLNRVVTSCIHS